MQSPSLLQKPEGDSDSANIFALPSAMTVETVELLAEQLRQFKYMPPTLTLDAAQTEIITTPGVQLLLALAKTLEANGVALRITEARPVFGQTFENLGLKTRFTEWEASKWLKQS